VQASAERLCVAGRSAVETDSIRSSGTNTLIDIWIDGKMRAICISHEAIGAFLGFEQAAALSETDRCEFVRTHLPLVVTAAKTLLHRTDPGAGTIILEGGHLPRSDGRSGNRRNKDLRKGERRTTDGPKDHQPERRRPGDRRQGGRRTRSAKPTKT
jgi:hypothetical protein